MNIDYSEQNKSLFIFELKISLLSEQVPRQELAFNTKFPSQLHVVISLRRKPWLPKSNLASSTSIVSFGRIMSCFSRFVTLIHQRLYCSLRDCGVSFLLKRIMLGIVFFLLHEQPGNEKKKNFLCFISDI